MKYIKLFEELRPETYISAGQKLKKKGHFKRGDELINYATSLRNNNEYDKSIYKYKILSSETIYNCKFVDYEISLTSSHSIEELIDGNSSIAYNIEFTFETSTGMLLKPFDFTVVLYSARFTSQLRGGELIKDNRNIRKVVNTIRIGYSNYNGPEDCIMHGLFADRRSAILFVREIMPTIPDDPDFNASEVVSLMERPNEELEDIYNMFNKIDVHTLYSDNENILEKKPTITK